MVISILLALQFVLDRKSGDHKLFTRIVNGKERTVQVDMGMPEYFDQWVKLLIYQSGFSREEFYGATKSTAKKINIRN